MSPKLPVPLIRTSHLLGPVLPLCSLVACGPGPHPSTLPSTHLNVTTSWTPLSLTVDIQVDEGGPRTLVVAGSTSDRHGIPCHFLDPQHSRCELTSRTLRAPLVGGDVWIAGVVPTDQGHTVSFPNWCEALNHCGYRLGSILG